MLKIYSIVNNTGKYTVWGTHQLDKVMEHVKCPCFIKIIWKGKKSIQGGGRTVNQFFVMTSDVPKDFDISKDLYQLEDEEKEHATE